MDATTPNIARMYDYWLGGKDNFAADRASAERIVEISEGKVLRGVKLNRAFLARAVRLAAAAGVDQFLDIGSGLPTQDNVHEVAQRSSVGARVVYVDYDPVVAAHGRAILGDREGVVFLEEDLRRPAEILSHPDVLGLLDFNRPIALILVAVLHFVKDEDDAYGIVGRLKDALAPGSHLILSHLANEHDPVRMAQTEEVYATTSAPLGARSHAEILRFFDGFDLVEPGLVGPTEWRTGEVKNPGEKFAGVVGVAIKP